MALTKQQVVDWLMRCGEVFTQQRDFLTQLDTEIGDSDHGLNMNRGFNKVVEKLPSVADKDIGFILKNTGMTLLSSVGGASGPLFGTFFIRAAQSANAKQSLDLAELHQMMQEGVEGVVMRGKAEPGDKTMCDAWWAVVESLGQSAQQQLSVAEALQRASERAEQAVESTITMQARKGRASYLGERSIGHQDPGATSVMLMMKTLAAVAGQ
ncbi:MAG: dihydroxyacetone kinase subunit DhaL [Serratia proteamaculans]|jgi:dihydroxyacetone kinase-like protein|uniref:Dihydroxyacetone kinase ADP-binding subunit DhaL n=1 Tax=Serratia proteamaculans TaxID=28151 RepID=A0ABS0TWU8_SERPR|nr:dihydroxyacetone kinase subunit DhaL [Serratia proteamaculans]SPZ51361.1 PTS-dependent dihydroxyacetone kinase, ADP-binding subunit dhaL [Serratia quinivorans]KAB1495413.1 dihydroxyacetone kinase ADP-binding subunit DhaL [Serratia proteamaculans]MBI6182841.1 dihydroxyacetone kinase ADP-binding subunit DhaL [Serratia proteamaculans]NWA72175.1 dihydroxyacetone kinase ADP-binding subunit DhaL [Serratia proteamaculans]RYM49840.1 dihydroxyacetone kinase subunit L [Serratia proteamaculans]